MASDDPAGLATQQSIKAYVDAQVGANNELSEVLANGNTTGGTDISVSSGDDITFANSSKAIFGAESDLQIYHDGFHSNIKESGAGSLLIDATNIYFRNAAGTKDYLDMADGGAVTVNYDNATKLATTSTGVDITGTLTADDITLSDADTPTLTLTDTTNTLTTFLQSGNSTAVLGTSTAHDIRFQANSTDAIRIANGGDITFYDTSGNASFVYDESAGSTFNENGDNKDFRVESDNNANMLFVNAGTNRIGMGTNNPTGSLHLLDVNDSGGADVYYVAQNTANNRPAGYKVLDESGNRVWQGYYDNGGNRGGLFIEPPGLGNADIGFDGTTFEISSNSSGAKLQLQSASTDRLTFYAANEVVFNEPGNNYDFRVESDNQTHMLFVNAGDDKIGIQTSTPTRTVDIEGPLENDGTMYTNFRLGTDDAKVGQRGAGISFGGNYRTSGNTPQTIGHIAGINGVFENGTDANYASALQFYTRKNGSSLLRQMVIGSSATVINEGGNDYDFRVESNNSQYMLYLDGGQDTVGIKTNATDAALNVNSQSNAIDGIRVVGSGGNNFITGYGNQGNISFSLSENGADDPGNFKLYRNGISSVFITADENTTTVFNDQGEDNDFRVESDSHTHMLFVDASQNTVGIGEENSPSAGVRLHVSKNDSSQYSSNGTVIQNDVPVKIQNLNTTTNLVMSGIHIRSGTWDGGVVGVPTNNGVDNKGFMALIAEVEEGARFYSSGGEGGTVINEHGVNRDFRVESDAQSHIFQVDAGNNQVRIGTQSAQIFTGTTPQLEVMTGGTGAGGIGIKSNTSTSQAKSALSIWTRADGSGSTAYAVSFYDGPTGTVEGSITVTNSGTTYNTTSDRRLKTDIQPITNGTEKLMAMKPVTHTWKADPEADAVHGFIAQEMQEIVPEAVSGDPDGEEMMSMDYGRITPVLVAALQEATNEIKALKQRVSELEAK
jgi:hypothetical protein